MRTWPPYQTLRPLIHANAGRTAIIMGGGPSLARSLDQCPLDALHFSVNDHGARLLKDTPHDGRKVEWIVACDKIEQRARLDIGRGEAGVVEQRDGQPWNVPVVSRHMWADYRMLSLVAPSSGMAAAWLARLMGCSPIILLGMDLYCGGTYFDAPTAKSSGRMIDDAHHFDRWCTVFKTYPAQYRFIGCSPLFKKIIQPYDPTEATDAPIPREKLMNEIRGTHVKLTREALISMREFQCGETLELAEGEAAKVIREKRAIKIKPPEV